VPLGFLAPDSYVADVYQDRPDGQIALRSQLTTHTGEITIPVATNVGFAVQLCPAPPAGTTCSG